jgi:hypothetical protein
VTENQSGEVGPVEPVEPTVLAPTPAAEAGVEAGHADHAPEAPKKNRTRARRGRIAAIVGCALLAVAVAGGVGYTVVTVNGADLDAGDPVWKFPKSGSGSSEQKAAPAKGLGAMLHPFNYAYQRGPDIAEFGADAQLTGREATALRKQEISGLPRSERLLLEKQIDREQIKGIAMRSFVYQASDDSNTYSIEVQLVQMDEKAARTIATYENELLDSTKGAFSKGPAVPGHKDARCFVPTQATDEKLVEMLCFANVGDVLITLDAIGTKSMDKNGIASFLREQLDRIKTTGEAV